MPAPLKHTAPALVALLIAALPLAARQPIPQVAQEPVPTEAAPPANIVKAGPFEAWERGLAVTPRAADVVRQFRPD
jgi:hypothetical protein